MGLRPDWSTEQGPGQATKQHREILSQKTTTTTKIYIYYICVCRYEYNYVLLTFVTVLDLYWISTILSCSHWGEIFFINGYLEK